MLKQAIEAVEIQEPYVMIVLRAAKTEEST